MFTKPKASTTARGYGGPHAKARKAAALKHRDTDPCVRCKHPLGPMGPHLHYDHDDARTGYRGFSHGTPCPHCGDRCNIKAGALKAKAKQVRIAQALQALGGRCPMCGKAIKAGRIYCSQRCGWVAHKDEPPRPKVVRTPKPPPEPKYCTMCGQPVPKGRSTLCSDDCNAERNARAARERYRSAHDLPPTWDRPVATAARW